MKKFAKMLSVQAEGVEIGIAVVGESTTRVDGGANGGIASLVTAEIMFGIDAEGVARVYVLLRQSVNTQSTHKQPITLT